MIPNPNVSRKPFPLPVVALGPGTQNDDAPEFPQFPKEMHTFTAPHGWMLRETGCSEAAVAWLERFFQAIAQCGGCGEQVDHLDAGTNDRGREGIAEEIGS